MAAIKSQLARPATALIVMASVQSVFASIPLVSMIFINSTSYSLELFPVGLFSVQFIASVLIAIGAAKMGHLESLAMGRMAAFLACIPVASPFVVCGLPFGIWALALLAKPDVQAAFQTRRDAFSETVSAVQELTP